VGGSTNWLDEQVRYYRHRAAEYDATTPQPGDARKEHEEVALEALRRFEPRGRALEIACGTGRWTAELVPYADSITALDASPEMLAIARQRVRGVRVRFVEADVFSWEPDAVYDVVFFAAWLSHVPSSHFERFWDLVRRCLDPGGRVFFLDEGRHDSWPEEFVDPAAGVVRRRLLDGSEHLAIKVLWEPAELERRLRERGWEIRVTRAGPLYWGQSGPEPA